MLNNFEFKYRIYDFEDKLMEALDSLSYDEEYQKDLDSKIIHPSKNELEIVDIVLDSIEKAEKPSDLKYITLDEAVTNAAYSIQKIDKTYIDYISKIPINVNSNFDEHCYCSLILKKFIDDICITRHIDIPSNLLSFSPICIGHEYIHSIKDIYYYEFLEKFTFSEVLTNFYELVAANTIFKEIKTDWRDFKLFSLSRIKDNYNELKTKRDIESLEEKKYYGVYLISIYYALVLYDMYKQDPNIILKKVNSVLKHKYTTGQMLDNLGIKNIDNENIKIFQLEKEILYS